MTPVPATTPGSVPCLAGIDPFFSRPARTIPPGQARPTPPIRRNPYMGTAGAVPGMTNRACRTAALNCANACCT